MDMKAQSWEASRITGEIPYPASRGPSGAGREYLPGSGANTVSGATGHPCHTLVVRLILKTLKTFKYGEFFRHCAYLVLCRIGPLGSSVSHRNRMDSSTDFG